MPWAELPAADESLTEICHIITDVARTSEGYYPRNYTMGYDKAKRLALWAAYPLHSCYTQGISRERHWGYDPTLAPGEQMTGGVSAPYNRGHQVANADRRVSNLANDQISYYSNMTAQRSNFNSGVWAALEGRVRGWMCADTLYVVTGCHFDGSQTSTIDNGGNTLPVPTQYYKVLLRSKNGSTGRSVASLPADELQAIGFWIEAFPSVSGTSATAELKKIAVPVAFIEQTTGIEFFPDVPASVKERFDPADWGF